MRSTSSAHKGLALLLCAVIALEGAGTAGWAFAENPPETCLLIKLSAPSVPEEVARERMAPVPQMLLRDLNVRWAPVPAAPVPQDPKGVFPEADDASLERISRTLAEALRRMERMETREAGISLSRAEDEARGFRLGEATRPLIAEIFLRRGLLSLWEGNSGNAEEMFARSRAIRPDFSPDPALFSPAFRDAWARSGFRPAPEAELLVQSIPPGASIAVDGKPRGTTPGRIRVSSAGTVRIRLAMAGYQDAERTGQWLPGDSESLEWVLGRDRIATLGELLAASPDGKGSGKLLAELAAGAGATRVCLLVLEDRNGKPVARVLSANRGESDPATLGELEWPSGEEGIAEAAGMTAKMLRDAGWPSASRGPQDTDAPWYHKWWAWVLVGAIVVGLAAGGGGGGSSGGSTGTVGVSF
jgi:hypothetical protein